MAVFDSDGLLLHKIRAVWDSNGVLEHAVSRILDSDGTALHPVYTNGVVLYENGVVNTELTGGLTGVYRTGGATVQMTESGVKLTSQHNPALNVWSNAIVWTQNPVDVTGFSALRVAFEAGQPQLGQMWLLAGPMRTQSGTSSDNPHNMPSLAGKVKSTTAGVLTLDLSAAEGALYLAFMNRPDGSWNSQGAATVTKFWLE